MAVIRQMLMDGLDLLSPDVTTQAEIEAFHRTYEGTNKGHLDSYEFWVEFRPDVLKRHKARTRHYRGAEAKAHRGPGILGQIHQYTIDGFAEGVAYEIRLAQSSCGVTRADILDTLSVAFIHTGHQGMYAAAASKDYLRTYLDPPPTDRFPPSWSFDPRAFDSGMDFSTPEVLPGDLDRLREWYLRTIGEIPRYVELLARHRPSLLKAYRDRYEHAIRDSLPKQMLPYLMLNYHVSRGAAEGIRENVLLGRALGMTREQLLDAICGSVLYSGINVLEVVDRAVGDLLEGIA